MTNQRTLSTLPNLLMNNFEKQNLKDFHRKIKKSYRPLGQIIAISVPLNPLKSSIFF